MESSYDGSVLVGGAYLLECKDRHEQRPIGEWDQSCIV
jgi:hypothetical protein